MNSTSGSTNEQQGHDRDCTSLHTCCLPIRTVAAHDAHHTHAGRQQPKVLSEPADMRTTEGGGAAKIAHLRWQRRFFSLCLASLETACVPGCLRLRSLGRNALLGSSASWSDESCSVRMLCQCLPLMKEPRQVKHDMATKWGARLLDQACMSCGRPTNCSASHRHCL